MVQPLNISRLPVPGGEADWLATWQASGYANTATDQYTSGPVVEHHLFSYRLKNPFGQCRSKADITGVYDIIDMATVSLASS